MAAVSGRKSGILPGGQDSRGVEQVQRGGGPCIRYQEHWSTGEWQHEARNPGYFRSWKSRCAQARTSVQLLLPQHAPLQQLLPAGVEAAVQRGHKVLSLNGEDLSLLCRCGAKDSHTASAVDGHVGFDTCE